ncbi:gliding motility lipoprotein GldH [Croceivirga thetidis]|uniref:Gliding motility lipoprotein GldH n=1 Tax=Croceivirga thetidis TaxID=2721623 RepID=A0ABX1GNC1_9FLAO|nr:gliding motility lipoprotein GldH [Croceivirga thetidis]NKI31139.1 gliding motility lipoprotein GldH [Croceivirga thetidis]
MLKKLFFGFLLVMLVSCSEEGKVFHEYQNLANGSWAANDTLSFDMPKFDPADNYNLFLNVRNDEGYPFSNLFLITYLDSPSGQVLIDTLEYQMAEPTGEWLGVGMGSVKESKLWYKESFQFKDSGNYKLRVRQAMRKNGEAEGLAALNGITDFGLEIQKVTQ